MHGASLMLDTWGGLSPHIPPVQSLLSCFLGSSSSPPRLHIKVSKEREQEKNLPEKFLGVSQLEQTLSPPPGIHWQLPVQSPPSPFLRNETSLCEPDTSTFPMQ